MIFITVGSRNFQFNRLLKAVDEAKGNLFITDEVFAQIGSSDYKPKNFEYIKFLNQEQFNGWLNKCDIVITHGGTGVIVNAVKYGKKVIAVPRLSIFHEVVDDHQVQIVREFEKMGMIIACNDCKNIIDAINQSRFTKLVNYESNTSVIIDSIHQFIRTECRADNE